MSHASLEKQDESCRVAESLCLFARTAPIIGADKRDRRVRVAPFKLTVGQTAQRIAPWRRAVAVLATLSFFWLSLIAQTHIHQAANPPSAASAKIFSHGGEQAAPRKAPAPDDVGDCPLCQAVSHGGAFIAPLFTTLIVVSLTQETLVWGVIPAKWSVFPGHNRQSRAPPRL